MRKELPTKLQQPEETLITSWRTNKIRLTARSKYNQQKVQLKLWNKNDNKTKIKS